MTNNERIEFVIDDVKKTIVSRGVERDLDDGERTIPRAVVAFNSITGNELSAEDGWLFMQILKMCRSKQGEFKYDDYRDGVGYAALRAEEALKNNDDWTGDAPAFNPVGEAPPLPGPCCHGYMDCSGCGPSFVPPECDTGHLEQQELHHRDIDGT
jgi:hypothetical protein